MLKLILDLIIFPFRVFYATAVQLWWMWRVEIAFDKIIKNSQAHYETRREIERVLTELEETGSAEKWERDD